MTDILVLLWLADVAEGLKTGLTLTGAIGAVIGLFYAIYAVIECDATLRKVIWFPAFGLTLCLFSALIPSKQWFYIAAGGTAAVKAMDSEIGKKVQVLVNQKLDEALGAKK